MSNGCHDTPPFLSFRIIITLCGNQSTLSLWKYSIKNFQLFWIMSLPLSSPNKLLVCASANIPRFTISIKRLVLQCLTMKKPKAACSARSLL